MDSTVAIRQLEKLVKGKLKKVKFKDIGRLNSYCHDDNGLITGLNLCYPGISDISFLSQPAFAHLTYLSIVKSQIIDIKPIQHLNQLTELYLFENKITDISPLQHLNRLIVLWLAFNQITDIKPLEGLKNIRVATLMHNKISKLPLDIITEWGMEIKWEYRRIAEEGIFIEGNPIENPPIEIVKQGKPAIQNYFKEISQKTVRLLHSKILIVGSGAVGKTTLMKKLINNDYHVNEGQEQTTHGINIVPWEINCSFGQEGSAQVKIYFWDFGGQEILYPTHQFFLTKRSLYIFVWDARQEGQENSSFDYWLNVIKMLSADSPVIVVMNKSDSRIQNIDEDLFKRKFGNIYEQFLQVSCITGKGIPELIEQIRNCLGSMQHLHDKLPKVWMEIRDELKRQKKDYITLSDYMTICENFHLSEERAEFLSDYLHDLGVILHFRRDKLLENTVILNPKWVTEAVYKIIDNLKIMENKGRFDSKDLKTYWESSTYPRETYPQLVRLMEKFDLCFPVTGKDINIVPELLPAKRPGIDFKKYDRPGSLRFEYDYEFMPRGIISRFISRLYYLISEDHFWKNGVEILFEDSIALIINDPLQRKIQIAVIGPSKSELLAIIRNEFNYIHRTLEMKKNYDETHCIERRKNFDYREKIACSCSQCRKSPEPFYIDYSLILAVKKNYRPLYCGYSYEDISMDELVKGIEITKLSNDLYVLIIKCAYQLQGCAAALKPEEDDRNTVMAMLLEAKGLYIKDQTRWGVSASGKSQGEVDIKIENPDPNYKTIIEAFTLKGLDRAVIKNHLLKLFGYDPSGFKQNFMLVYSEADDFSSLWEKYLDYITEVEYPYRRLNEPEIINTSYAEIKAACLRFDREGEETLVYHIFINLKPKRL